MEGLKTLMWQIRMELQEDQEEDLLVILALLQDKGLQDKDMLAEATTQDGSTLEVAVELHKLANHLQVKAEAQVMVETV